MSKSGKGSLHSHFKNKHRHLSVYTFVLYLYFWILFWLLTVQAMHPHDRSALQGEGAWVTLISDPSGRLSLHREECQSVYTPPLRSGGRRESRQVTTPPKLKSRMLLSAAASWRLQAGSLNATAESKISELQSYHMQTNTERGYRAGSDGIMAVAPKQVDRKWPGLLTLVTASSSAPWSFSHSASSRSLGSQAEGLRSLSGSPVAQHRLSTSLSPRKVQKARSTRGNCGKRHIGSKWGVSFVSEISFMSLVI